MQHWPRHLKWIAPLMAVVGLAVLYFFPPAQYGFYPRCLFFSLTGFACPGCGSLRSVHHLLHGEVAAAFYLNPLLFVGVPALILCRRQIHKPAWLWSFAVAVILFTVGRNL